MHEDGEKLIIGYLHGGYDKHIIRSKRIKGSFTDRMKGKEGIG